MEALALRDDLPRYNPEESSVARHAPERVPGHELTAQIEAACERACQSIAPAWPLDRAVAVNPHWARTGRPLRLVAARMAVLGGVRVFPSRRYIADAWSKERITHADLAYALASLPVARENALTAKQCIDALRNEENPPRLPLLIDVLDADPARENCLTYRQAVTHQIGQTCAAYFDDSQAEWQPDRSGGLYAFWRNTLTHDHGIGTLMGIPELGKWLDKIPVDRRQAETWVLQRLGLPPEVWADYLEAVLLSVNGWASWCAYLGWQAVLAGETDPHLRDLLAIRLAWGVILLESNGASNAHRAFSALQTEWNDSAAVLRHAQDMLTVDEVWQVALETGYQRQLTRKLSTTSSSRMSAVPRQSIEVQAAFCIDVRSERMRRSIEAVWPAVQTIGFAGFFGLPVAYAPLGTSASRPQLPALLAPSLGLTDRIIASEADRAKGDATLRDRARRGRRRRFALSEQGQALGRWPNAAFSFVEAAGVGYVGNLRNGSPHRAAHAGETIGQDYRHVTEPSAAQRSAIWIPTRRWSWPRACCTRWDWTVIWRLSCCSSATAVKAATMLTPRHWIAAPAAVRRAK